MGKAGHYVLYLSKTALTVSEIFPALDAVDTKKGWQTRQNKHVYLRERFTYRALDYSLFSVVSVRFIPLRNGTL
jgi:hypothetical protein